MEQLLIGDWLLKMSGPTAEIQPNRNGFQLLSMDLTLVHIYSPFKG